MRVLLDTNVILDFLLDREPFAETAAAVWQAAEEGRIEAYVSAITPVNVFYIAWRLRNAAEAHQIVTGLLAACEVCLLDRTVLVQALELPFRDYEDAVQHASAVAGGMDAIITRDVGDYITSELPIYDPVTFLEKLAMQENNSEGQ